MVEKIEDWYWRQTPTWALEALQQSGSSDGAETRQRLEKKNAVSRIISYTRVLASVLDWLEREIENFKNREWKIWRDMGVDPALGLKMEHGGFAESGRGGGPDLVGECVAVARGIGQDVCWVACLGGLAGHCGCQGSHRLGSAEPQNSWLPTWCPRDAPEWLATPTARIWCLPLGCAELEHPGTEEISPFLLQRPCSTFY